MLETRLALDRRDSTTRLRAEILMRLAELLTRWSFALTAVAFTCSRAVMGIFFSTAFSHFECLLEIFPYL